MVTVPQRLLSDSRVTILLQDRDAVVLHKVIEEQLFERSSYLAMHALSFVSRGTQVIQAEERELIRITAGQAGLMQRGLYTISDLLASEKDSFSVTVVFFSDALIRELKGKTAAIETKTTSSLVLQSYHAPTLPARWSKTGVIGFLQELPIDFSSLLRIHKSPLREFMSAHFDKPFAVADYAYLTGRSERSFRRDFKARFGESPKRWLIERRLERSRELLQSRQVHSVQAAAMSVGYASVSHFIKLYSSYFGVTPGGEVAT